MSKGVLAWLGMAMMTVAAAAQTGTVPLDSGTPPSGLTNSNITVLNGNVGIGTTQPIATLDVVGSSGTRRIFQEINTGQPDYSYYYLTLFKIPTGTGWDATTLNAKVCVSRSNDIGVTQCAEIFASRDYYSNIFFSEITPSIGYGGPFQFVTVANGGANWATLLYDTHSGPGPISWTIDGTLSNGNSVDVVSFTSITSTSPKHSTLSYSARNISLPYGNVGIGTTNPGAKLEVSGNLKLTSGSGGSITFQDGTTQSTAYTGVVCGGDYAESVDVTGDRTKYEPGDVLVIDPAAPGRFLKANTAYSKLVAGIYSTKPGTVGRRQSLPQSKDEVPMAMIGIVPTKVSAENGPITTGDLLVASSATGRAMKGTDQSKLIGAVIGKALGSLESGIGVIEVLVALQ